ncbi:hypothetical protein NKK52_30865 [Mesorhizobium sp. C277A]|uniref:hypothetical protein n=1 Tax=unclassified Mesorhizobium TaxID=325217 RepID=UPI0012ECB221|nr:hypothetical protein [Mesorhizobium sp. LSJC277A00]
MSLLAHWRANRDPAALSNIPTGFCSPTARERAGALRVFFAEIEVPRSDLKLPQRSVQQGYP